jgi:uncharacterized protein
MTAAEIIRMLDLKPLGIEGGYFRETYRCAEGLSAERLPPRYGGPRSFGTAIYYLITPTSFSRLHRLKSDEVYHFLLGDPVRILQLPPGGAAHEVILGPDIAAGQQLQAVVPAGVWQGSRLIDGGSFALLGVTVAPGFEYADFEAGDIEQLVRQYPAHAEFIRRLA